MRQTFLRNSVSPREKLAYDSSPGFVRISEHAINGLKYLSSYSSTVPRIGGIALGTTSPIGEAQCNRERL